MKYSVGICPRHLIVGFSEEKELCYIWSFSSEESRWELDYSAIYNIDRVAKILVAKLAFFS